MITRCLLHIVYISEDIGAQRTAGAVGNFTPDEALKHLLAGTGLTYRYLDEQTVSILPFTTTTGAATPSSAANAGEIPAPSPDDVNKEGKRDSSGTFRMAQVDQGSAQGTATVGHANRTSTNEQSNGPELTEIIVTAEKRSERLLEVPVPVTVINAQSLVDNNQFHLQDYFSSIPGLNVSTSSAGGYQLLSIRGITTGLANPSVGVTIDDVPFGSSTLYGGNVPPDIDPNDLARVEVLRGPQGTLYGASSIGGLIKYVTVDPSTEQRSGHLQAGLTSVRNGDSVGYSVSGAVNVPLSDSLAIRASGFTRIEPGYIDNPVLGIKGVNKNDADGGHVSVLWRPSDLVSLKVSALLQEFKAHGSPDVDRPVNGYVGPILGDLQQNYIPGAGAYDTKVQAYSATLKASLGGVELTSVTGYNINGYTSTVDFTYLYGPYTQNGVAGTGFNGFGVAGSPLYSDATTKKFTQEFRAASSLTKSIDWLLGAFYTHEEGSPSVSNLLAENATTGAIAGLFGSFSQPSTFQEYALFSDLTFHVTPRLNVQVGGRESRITQSNQETDSGPYVLVFEGVASPNVGPTYRAKANAFTYLVTPQFNVSPELMLYARLASGYRVGGPNPAIGVPPEYSPDKTYNYEVGVKGEAFDRRLSFDASVYYIDWKNIQLELSNPVSGFEWTGNAGAAKSQGVELSVESRPLQGLKITTWVAWSDAVLTEPLPPGYPGISAVGSSGDRLPYSPRLSGYLSMEQEFPLWNGATGFVGGVVSYIGDRQSVFTQTPAREYFPGYAKTDLRAGTKYESWTLNIVLNNAFDRRGILDGGLGSNIPFDYHYLQPRTVGVSVAKDF